MAMFYVEAIIHNYDNINMEDVTFIINLLEATNTQDFVPGGAFLTKIDA